MLWAPLVVALNLIQISHQAMAADAPAGTKKAAALGRLAQRVIADGIPNRIVAPLARLIDVPPDSPVHQVVVSTEQATDGGRHLFRVRVELTEAGPKPIGLVLTYHVVRNGDADGYWYRASLDGTLEKAVLIRGKRDAQGQEIKGSGTAIDQDIGASDTKSRFDRELELWLKKSYLKKEWRNAEFSGGVLTKKALRR